MPRDMFGDVYSVGDATDDDDLRAIREKAASGIGKGGGGGGNEGALRGIGDVLGSIIGGVIAGYASGGDMGAVMQGAGAGGSAGGATGGVISGEGTDEDYINMFTPGKGDMFKKSGKGEEDGGGGDPKTGKLMAEDDDVLGSVSFDALDLEEEDELAAGKTGKQ